MDIYQNRYPHMVQNHYERRLRELMQERRQRLQKITSVSAAEEYVRTVRKKLAEIFVFPERTPLNPHSYGIIDEAQFTIEKITYESRPGFMVPGNLYRPKTLPYGSKAPAVLVVCGHALTGKAAYQTVARNLAAKGFITLIIDPISQGERWQHADTAPEEQPVLCQAHNLMGNQQILLDDFFGTWRLWDAIRGLDYLLSIPEVDPEHLGVTGNSGGGTLTSFVAALDPRPTMVAPSCYICSWRANMDNELPADAEQNPPGALAAGLDHADLLAAYPRATIILSQKHDFFDERYARLAHQELKTVHEKLESNVDVEYFMGPTVHGYSKENREAMLKFFMKQSGIDGSAEELDTTILPDKELWITESGNITEKGSILVRDILKKNLQTAISARPQLKLDQLQQTVREHLNLPAKIPVPYYSCLRNRFVYRKRETMNMITQFTVETAPDIKTIITLCSAADQSHVQLPQGKVRMYLGHTGSEQDFAAFPEIQKLAADDVPLLLVDPRGIGESESRACDLNGFFAPYGADYLYAVTGDMLKESYCGRRIYDVLATIELLLAHGVTEIELTGRGLGAVTAAFAALLQPAVTTVTLINYLPDYQTLISTPTYRWPLSVMPRGILKSCDLPDIYQALGKKLTLRQPWNHNLQ